MQWGYSTYTDGLHFGFSADEVAKIITYTFGIHFGMDIVGIQWVYSTYTVGIHFGYSWDTVGI